jgi:hypothetical protein
MNIETQADLFAFMEGYASWAEDESPETYHAALYDAVEAYCKHHNDKAGHLVCFINLYDVYFDYSLYLENKATK